MKEANLVFSKKLFLHGTRCFSKTITKSISEQENTYLNKVSKKKVRKKHVCKYLLNGKLPNKKKNCTKHFPKQGKW